MGTGLTAAFWGVSMLFVLTPGVDWAYAITAGVRHRAGVLPAVSGMLAGHLTATLIVAAGVAAVLAASPTAMTVLTLAGAGYLICLGIAALRHPAAPNLDREAAPTAGRGLFVKGIGISLLNPKVFLLFLALLPQFTTREAAWPVGAQMIILGVLHVANCTIVYFAIGYGASTILTRSATTARVVGIASGIMMIGFGIALAAERIVTLVE